MCGRGAFNVEGAGGARPSSTSCVHFAPADAMARARGVADVAVVDVAHGSCQKTRSALVAGKATGGGVAKH